MRRTRSSVIVLSILAALAVSMEDARAIPAFARKYGFSCTTCHAPAPRLKAFGEEFAGRGFRLDDPAKEPPRATLDTGDPLLRLVRDVPLAIRLDGYASHKKNERAQTDFESPWVLKFLSGGPINDRLSYYFYFLVEQGEVVGLEDTFIQYNRLFNLPVDIVVGQFQVSDPLFKRELRLMRADYDIFTTRVGHSVINLSYDRGLVATWHAPAQVDALLQVTNGNGIDPPDEAGNFDQDEKKNFSLRLVRAFGPVRVGLFGLRGSEVDPATRRENTATYFGPDFVFELGERVVLSMEYLERRDDNPFFDDVPRPELKTRGGFAEIHWFPRGQDGRVIITGLYNKVSSDDDFVDREGYTLTVSHLLARNARLLLEGHRMKRLDPAREEPTELTQKRLTLGLVLAF